MIEKGTRFDLHHGGFIQVIDWMGDDAAIVQAARVSYGEGTKTVREDRGLIRYLMRNWHTTPFEMCELKLLVKVPMDTWRQWIRHRTASVNEYSTRYSIAIDEMAETLPGDWRVQSTTNKQGSEGYLDVPVGKIFTDSERDLHNYAREVYEERIAAGIAREQARKDLPLSTFTQAFWKIDLHNLFHFLRLRMDSHAQVEIRRYADIIGEEVVQELWPLAWEAFVDYRLESVSMSRMEMELIRSFTHADPSGFENDPDAHGMSSREMGEFLKKVGFYA